MLVAKHPPNVGKHHDCCRAAFTSIPTRGVGRRRTSARLSGNRDRRAVGRPNNTVTIDNQGQVLNVPPQSQVCDDDLLSDGLLGDLPVLGNLPGLGGVL
jgi:hypothetical protein